MRIIKAKMFWVVCLIMGLAHLHKVDGQQSQISSDYVSEVVKKTGALFAENYVFPKKGNEVLEYLLKRLEQGAYDSFTVIDSLTPQLKKDILKITQDKHVNFIIENPNEKPTQNEEDPMLSFFNSLENFGITNVEILGGNVGLLEITFFYPIRMKPEAAKAAAEAMERFLNCKAIVFDLRKCKGGDPEMLNYLITYLYPENQKIHLNTFYFRPLDQYEETYTLDDVPGKRMPEMPVFVLTSANTFSCGEEFAYDLKNLERGILIGETTGGAAHPVQPRRINTELQVLIPVGRAINPITKNNWEGKGVVPHHKISEEKALDRALELINSLN